jgi:hypothetical protein
VQIPSSDNFCIKVSRVLELMARQLPPNPLVDRLLGERKFAGKRDKPIDEAHGGNPKSARDVLDGRTLKRGRCWDALLSRGRDSLGGRVSHRGCGAK